MRCNACACTVNDLMVRFCFIRKVIIYVLIITLAYGSKKKKRVYKATLTRSIQNFWQICSLCFLAFNHLKCEWNNNNNRKLYFQFHKITCIKGKKNKNKQIIMNKTC